MRPSNVPKHHSPSTQIYFFRPLNEPFTAATSTRAPIASSTAAGGGPARRNLSSVSSPLASSLAPFSPMMMHSNDMLLTGMINDSPISNFQWSVHEASAHMLKHIFRLMFSHLKDDPKQLLIVPIWQRTDFDMRTFKDSVTAERERLGVAFITWASKVCSYIRERNEWADFVDPGTAYPYFDRARVTPYVETDDALSCLGYDIVDVVCCKVVSHPVWKTKAFLATLFTTAPKLLLQDAIVAAGPLDTQPLLH